MTNLKMALSGAAALMLTAAAPAFACDTPIKVGVLHSLSGTMAISETTLKDTMLMLVLQPEQFTQRNVSLTAQARAAELELSLSVDFTLNQQASDPIDARATVTRQMLNDPRNVVGKTEEIRLLREEMRRDLADQIARRISYSLGN